VLLLASNSNSWRTARRTSSPICDVAVSSMVKIVSNRPHTICGCHIDSKVRPMMTSQVNFRPELAASKSRSQMMQVPTQQANALRCDTYWRGGVCWEKHSESMLAVCWHL